MKFNANTKALQDYSKTLAQLHKSAFPSAIRGTLNKAAAEVKMKTMPEEATKTFVNREKNFFKANSRFKPAQGFDISTMQAIVGFIPDSLKGSNNFSVSDLEQQEHGGVIKGKSFIPLRQARKGNSANQVVRPNARISKIKNLVRAGKMNGKTKKERFMKAVLKAGRGGFVIGTNQIVYKINSLKTKTLGMNLTPLYKFKKRGTVRVKQTNFMQKASEESASHMEKFYKEEANRQIMKYQK